MIHCADLRIEDEILPLFDFTFNYHSGQAVRALLLEPPSDMKETLHRQQVLKGFQANRALLKEYSFSRFNLAEIYDFLESFEVGSLSAAKLRWKLTFNETERSQKRGKIIQLILLFHKIYFTYTSKLDLNAFPPDYAKELAQLNRFFLDFDPERYEGFIRKKKLDIGDVVDLMLLIARKTTSGEMGAFWQRWFQFEAWLSISNGISKNGFNFPVFDQSNFKLTAVYHPLVRNAVRNDLTATRNLILLTGPNMSGKSTLLKAISLCVYLAHAGLAVPAAAASMPYYKNISVAINLTDSVVSGYSHFMSEVFALKTVVQEARNGDPCFAVFDELFRGTNIEDALEISSTTIRGLTRFKNSLFFISTHLHQLRDMEEIKSGQVTSSYIECNLDKDTPVFTYKLKDGWSDLKLGRILFEKEGLNKLLNV